MQVRQKQPHSVRRRHIRMFAHGTNTRILLVVLACLVTTLIIGCASSTASLNLSTAVLNKSTNSNTSVQNNANSPAWLAKPRFANVVLHWTQIVANYSLDSSGSMSGQQLTGDIWVAVGSDGLPTQIHVRYAQDDGTVVQEIIQTRSTETDLFGSGSGNLQCRTAPHLLSTQDLQVALPPFVNSANLPASDYQQIKGAVSHPHPSTSMALAGVTPSHVYASGIVTQTWQLHATHGSMNDNEIVSFGADSRILAHEVQLFDGQGKMIQRNWHSYGALQVYTSVPAKVFSFSTQSSASCD